MKTEAINVGSILSCSVMPGGMSGILGDGAGTGALKGLGLPSLGASEGTEEAAPMSPIPLGF